MSMSVEPLDVVKVDQLETPVTASMPANTKWHCRPNCILVKRFEPVKEVGGIQLPQAAQENQSIGEVLLSGDPDIPIGAYVIWQQYAGIPMPSATYGKISNDVIVPVEEVLMVGMPPALMVDPDALKAEVARMQTIAEQAALDTIAHA